MNTRPRRIGVFGGTFDPPHVGHASVARDVADALALDEVVWIPAGRSPHKPDVELTDGALRMAMVRCVANDDARFSIDELELLRSGLSYSVDTLEALATEYDGAALYLILGEDQYRVFDRWKEPERIRELATVVVMDRDGQGGATSPDQAVAVGRVDVSASEVRAAVKTGRSIGALVHPCVLALIREHDLYVNADR
ncbi:MAG: nicotinate (nicotinamide) nucleotide adenylyltransferase [Gemmatimonadota bacterium]